MATDSQDGVEERPALGRLDLIVAIACLVALATMAVPRQQRMSSDTRRMEVAALAGSIDGAARFGHALWQAQGGAVVAGASGASVRIVNGYPEPETLPLLMEAPETMAFLQQHGLWQHRDVPASAPCGVRYAPPVRPGEEPRIERREAGC